MLELVCLDNIRRTPVKSLKEICLVNLRVFVRDQVLAVSRMIVSLYSTHDCVAAGSQYIPDFQEFIFSQVLACDVEDVANEILVGVEDALAAKKKEYVDKSSINIQKFSNEVNLVVRFVELICIENLKKLSLEDIPHRLRADLLINISKMTGLRELYLGYGSVNPERMDRYYSEAFIKMRNLTHFSLKRNCTDKIIQILSKASPYSLQLLDVENSRDVTDESVQFICIFKLRELNIFNCSISTRGICGVLQTNHNLRVLKRGVPLCDALEYQALINEATWTAQKKFKLQVFQASETKHFHTNTDMDLVAEACPDIQKMIFKYNAYFFTSYIQLAVFDKLQHFETWGGEYQVSGLGQLLEVIGYNLTTLHLCHVEEISAESLIHLTKNCKRLRNLIFENCSYNVEGEDEMTEEELEIRESKVPLLLDLKTLKVINFMSLSMVLMLLRKSLNIVIVEIDSENELTDQKVVDLLKVNKLQKLENLLVFSSKYKNWCLSLGTALTLVENCPQLRWIRYLDGWRGNTREEVIKFWRFVRENNIDLDCGEEEWKEDMEKRRERSDIAKNKEKSSFCSTDILSKMFGPSFQEGEGYAEGDKHLMENAFPQEGEGQLAR